MRIIDLKDFSYDTDWMDNLELRERKGREIGVVYVEYDELVSKLEPGESFIQAMYKRRILERDDGKYQIIFRHEDLPVSMKKWHKGDYIFKGLLTDLMPLRVAFQPQLRELDNW
jgi:hypothetical protein